MNLLNKLTKKNLLLNKKRTIVTIIGIILSVALITSVASMYSSTLKSFINYEKYERGDFHVMFANVDKDGIEIIKNNKKVENVFLTKSIGYALLEDSQNEGKPYAFIMGFTKESLNSLSIKLVDGRLPEKENEILIPTHLKTNARIEYKIGDKIKLNVGTRVLGDTVLTQDIPFSSNDEEDEVIEEVKEEKIIDTKEVEYTVVGIIERPANNIEAYSAPGYTFATIIDEKSITSANVYTKYTKAGMKDYITTTAEILGVDPVIYKKVSKGDFTHEEFEKYEVEVKKSKYEIVSNDYLIILESDPLGDGTFQGLGVVVLIVCIIIIVSSVFCIKNSFDISIIEKTKQYGMLRSIGATKKQIRNNVLYEAFILGIIGIPLGVILGLLASFILCLVCNLLLKDLTAGGFNVSFVVNVIAVIFSIILGSLTIYLSAFRGAIRASRVSPIELIRNSGEIKIKKQYKCKLINKLFGIGGVLSYKNLKRNKKKYRATAISIVISTTIFIALTYFVTLFYDEVKEEIGTYESNIKFNVEINNQQDEKKLNEALKLDLVENYSVNREEFLDIKDVKRSNNKKYKKYIEEFTDSIQVISIGDYQYNKYIKELNLDESVKDKGIIYDYFTLTSKTERNTIHILNYKVGDKITMINDYQEDKVETSVEVGAIVEKTPYSVSAKTISWPVLIVSDSTFSRMFPDYTFYNVHISASDPNKYQDIILSEIYEKNELYVSNIEEEVKTVKNVLLLLCIFLYGFIIVVTLIGITNIFNTITANMELRKPEFAMLKSVGMTSKEFTRMIRLESIFICFKSLVIAIILGSGLSYLIYYKLADGSMIKFTLPIVPIIGAIIGVLLLIYIIMKFSISKINKQNTIETIRNENI